MAVPPSPTVVVQSVHIGATTGVLRTSSGAWQVMPRAGSFVPTPRSGGVSSPGGHSPPPLAAPPGPLALQQLPMLGPQGQLPQEVPASGAAPRFGGAVGSDTSEDMCGICFERAAVMRINPCSHQLCGKPAAAAAWSACLPAWVGVHAYMCA